MPPKRKKAMLNVAELGKRIEAILSDYRAHYQPLESSGLRREIATRIRKEVRQMEEEAR